MSYLTPKQSYGKYINEPISYQAFKRWEQVFLALRDAPGQIDTEGVPRRLVVATVHRAMLVGIEFLLMFPFSELHRKKNLVPMTVSPSMTLMARNCGMAQFRFHQVLLKYPT